MQLVIAELMSSKAGTQKETKLYQAIKLIRNVRKDLYINMGINENLHGGMEEGNLI